MHANSHFDVGSFVHCPLINSKFRLNDLVNCMAVGPGIQGKVGDLTEIASGVNL